MAVLVTLALCLILGVLQVSSYECKDIQISNTEYRTKCYENAYNLLDDKLALRVMYYDLDGKKMGIDALIKLLNTAKECYGKEYEDKKCQDELLDAEFNVEAQLDIFNSVFRGLITEVLANLSRKANDADNEISCCCKLVFCDEKRECPTCVYKGCVKECKGEYCTGQLNKNLKALPYLLQLLITAREREAKLAAYLEDIQKMKESIPKDGKCKEEKDGKCKEDKGLYALGNAIHKFNIAVSEQLEIQALVNDQSEVVRQLSAAAALENLLCTYGKDSNQYSICY